MECNESRPLLHAYADHELDASNALDIQEHLESCEACRHEFDEIRATREAAGKATSYAAPDRLRESLHRSFGVPEFSTPARPAPWRFALLAASLFLIGMIGWSIGRMQGGPQTAQMAEIFDLHVRSLMPGHLTDVASTDQHTVKPYFNGILSFSPPVSDFRDQGFPLLGGRVDFVEGHQAAVLVYGVRKHRISVFIWPGSALSGSSTHDGFHSVAWTKDGLQFVAVSDVAEPDLDRFIALLQR